MEYKIFNLFGNYLNYDLYFLGCNIKMVIRRYSRFTMFDVVRTRDIQEQIFWELMYEDQYDKIYKPNYNKFFEKKLIEIHKNLFLDLAENEKISQKIIKNYLEKYGKTIEHFNNEMMGKKRVHIEIISFKNFEFYMKCRIYRCVWENNFLRSCSLQEFEKCSLLFKNLSENNCILLYSYEIE